MALATIQSYFICLYLNFAHEENNVFGEQQKNKNKKTNKQTKKTKKKKGGKINKSLQDVIVSNNCKNKKNKNKNKNSTKTKPYLSPLYSSNKKGP